MNVDLNCDLGEGGAFDDQLIPLITSANIACGGHAGDPETMRKTVRLALAHNVNIGAHPGYADRANFGRKELYLPPGQVRSLVVSQITVLRDIAEAENAKLRHVKPHGGLYNLSAKDPAVADEIAGAIRQVDPSLVMIGLAGSELISAGRRAGLATAAECFADRAYQDDGSLVPRSQPNAVIHDESKTLAQALMMLKEHHVLTITGKAHAIVAETICVHGDTPNAVGVLQRLRAGLLSAEIEITKL
jgi:UPF0271 protein